MPQKPDTAAGFRHITRHAGVISYAGIASDELTDTRSRSRFKSWALNGRDAHGLSLDPPARYSRLGEHDSDLMFAVVA